VPETLMNELTGLERAYLRCKGDEAFQRELGGLLSEYGGRPSLLYFAEKMTRDLGGPEST
jgi:tryptophan synthase beta chain